MKKADRNFIMNTTSTPWTMAKRKTWTPEEIRALRNSLRLNQTDFADRLGYERRQTVTDLETGLYAPSGPVRRLLDVLEAEAQRQK